MARRKTKTYIQKTPSPVYVTEVKKMGRGVFANTTFEEGEIVLVTPLLRLSPGDNEFIAKTAVQYYTFDSPNKMSGDSYLALGEGSLLNHSDYSDNLDYEIEVDMNYIIFKAKRAIKAGEQLFIDYGWDL